MRFFDGRGVVSLAASKDSFLTLEDFNEQKKLAEIVLGDLLNRSSNYIVEWTHHSTSLFTKLKEIVPFDLSQHPNVYFDLIIEKIMVPDLAANIYDYRELLANAINEKIISRMQGIELFLYYCLSKRQDGNYKFTIDEVCELLSGYYCNTDWHDKERTVNFVAKNYVFKDLAEKEYFLDRMYNVLNQYPEIDLSYEEVFELHKNGKTSANSLVGWIIDNFAIMSEEKRGHILGLIAEVSERSRCSRIADLNEVLKPQQMIKLLAKIKSTDGLMVALQKQNYSRDEMLSKIQSFIEKIDSGTHGYSMIGLSSLKLTQEEILDFVKKNPQRNEELDLWVSENMQSMQFTQQDLEFLLDQRIILGQDDCKLYQSVFDLYKIDDARKKQFLYKCLENNGTACNNIISKLPWEEIYRIYLNHCQGLFHSDDFKDVMPSFLQSYFDIFMNRSEDNDIICSYYDDLPRELTKLDKANKKFGNNFAIPDESLLLSTITRRFIPKQINEETAYACYQGIEWVMALTVRLAQEVTSDRITRLCDQRILRMGADGNPVLDENNKPIHDYVHIEDSAAIKKIANVHAEVAFGRMLYEIAGLAAPEIRVSLLENIINIANDDNKIALLGAVASSKKCSVRHYIPALIMISSLSAEDAARSVPGTALLALDAVDRMDLMLHTLQLIDNDYSDNNKLKVLINAFLPIFACKDISYEDKCEIVARAFRYDLVIAKADNLTSAQLLGSRHLSFTQMHIFRHENGNFELQAYDLYGNLIVLDLKNTRQLQEMKQAALIPNQSHGLQVKLSKATDLLEAWREKNKELTFSDKQKQELIREIIKTGVFPCGVNSALQAFAVLQGVAALGNLAEIVEVGGVNTRSWMSHLGSLLEKCFAVNGKNLTNIVTYLHSCREPLAVVAYYAQLKKLPRGKKYVDLLKQFVGMLASKDFAEYYSYRYSYAQQPQLKAVIADNYDLLRKWKDGSKETLDAFMETTKDYERLYKVDQGNVIKYLRKQILHHLSKSRCKYIYEYLDNPQHADTLLSAAKSEINGLQKCAYSDIRNIYKRAMITMQIKLIEFFECANEHDKQYQINMLSDIKLCMSNCDKADIVNFQVDLDMAIASVKSDNGKQSIASKQARTWTIENTDAPEDMLLIGTEVDGSCQNINGSAQLNRCLIGGYVLSGHIRQIAIKDENGRIIARAVFRLMRDVDTLEPVLFLEEVYPSFCADRYKQAIELLACASALQLNCNLVRAESPLSRVFYQGSLEVVAVKLAEYVDALYSEQDGEYSIDDSIIHVFNPVLYREAKKRMQVLADPQFGPSPLAAISDFKFMYRNYQQKFNGGETGFWQKIGGSDAQSLQAVAHKIGLQL